MSKALVVGGGGFLGQALVTKLVARGDQVRILARGNYSHLEALGVECLRGDITKKEDVLAATSGVDVVYHTASKAGIWGDFAEYERINVQGTRHILQACLENKVKVLVYTSTPSVIYHPKAKIENIQENVPYPDEFDCAYAQTKAQAEKEVLAANCANLATVAIRPHLIYGPGDTHLIPRVVERALKGQLFQVGDGTNKVDITYVDNAALAHINAFENIDECAGKAYFISDGEPVVLWDWINELLNKIEAPPIKFRIPFLLTWCLGAVLEFVYKLLKKKEEPKMTRFTAEQLATSHYFNIDNARRDLHYVPEVSGQEGLNKLVAWVKSQGNLTVKY
ncbi:NAD-dependent epimerase/dehydratase family protein [bacterium]|nr:NAD-dependent epimerase/dehydratase family protein [bacterium]